MPNLGLDYQQAKELVEKNVTDPITKMHLRESEVIMRALAKHFGEDKEGWGIVGLLHDIDWDLTKKDTEKHCVTAVEILKNAGASDYLIETIISHCYGFGEYKDKTRNTRIQHALTAAETLTGLIIANTLVQPDRKLKSVKVDSLMRRFKDKSFAAKCDRERIREGEKIGLTLEEFLSIGLQALQSIDQELGF